jgi:serine/threonine-protein kinase
MLAGEPPHIGGSAQQIIMKIIAEQAQPLTALRKSVPANVAAAVAKSLEKLPADRFESAAAFSAALVDPGFTTANITGAGGTTASQGVPRSALVAGASLGAVLLGAALWGWLRPAEVPPTTRQEVVLWSHPLDRFTSPGIERYATQAAIAPDGSSIVFTDSVGNSVQLFRKLRDQERPTPLAGGEEGMSPFFSPDGRWIGFITLTGQLRKIPVEGGTPITLSSQAVAGYPTGAWLENDRIVFIGDEAGDGLRIISATPGDTAMSVTGSVSGGRSQNIVALPGSRGVLYTRCPGNCTVGSSVYVFDFEADSAHELIPDAAGAWYSPTGHLLYTARTGGLFAAGFDLDRMELTTGPIPVLADVAATAFTLSPSGSVLYSVGTDVGGASELVWVTRDGQATPVDSSWHGVFHYPAVSPDGTAIAVSLDEGTTQLWVWREGGTRQKLTQDGTVNWRPFWKPDGRSIAFLSNRRGGEGPDNYDAYLVPADGSSGPELLLRHTFGLWEVEFTQDESWMVIRADEEGRGRIRGRRTTGDTTLVPLVAREAETSTQLALSPDGNWIAYVLVIDGVRNVYVSPFPSIASLRLVSRGEATEPRWSRSGRELFFKSNNQLMKVDVGPGPGLSLGTPRPLFPLTGYVGARNRPEYDVAPGDDRFLMIRFLENAEAESRTIYVENWFEELGAKVQQ